MDNFHIDITSAGDIGDALKIAMRGRKATHFSKGAGAFVLLWTAHKDAIALPVAMVAVDAAPIIASWLKNEAEYGPGPDIDGSCSRGWRISCDDWGHVKPFDWAGLVRIEPRWAMHGK